MGRGRTKGDHAARRTEIAEAACDVILRLGLAQASLSQIAREMGYTTGILRHYFSDKEELLLAAKNLLFDRSLEKARAAALRNTGIDRLRAMAISLLPRDSSGINRHRLLTTFNGHAIGDARLMRLQSKRNERHWEFFEEAIAALQGDGTLSKTLDPRLEACGVLALIEGLADQIIMDPKTWTSNQMIGLVSAYIDCLGHR
jgi:AcrR family transcriptional regulator